ncbi:MAG: hypothetical protein M3P91_12355 [Actinomycetota bacterium]|nr:hypothetical protein [Actinomycetota bacterium]
MIWQLLAGLALCAVAGAGSAFALARANPGQQLPSRGLPPGKAPGELLAALIVFVAGLITVDRATDVVGDGLVAVGVALLTHELVRRRHNRGVAGR